MCHFLKTILVLSLANVPVAWSQITGNVHVKDPKALAITADLHAALCGKKWHCLRMVETRRSVWDEFEDCEKNVEFSCNGEYNPGYIADGTWAIVNEQYLKISPTNRPNSRNVLSGAYSIYSLSDSTLVLGQILTSTGDWTKEYTFTTSPKPRISPLLKWVYDRRDSIKAGKQVKYHPDGQVSSIGHYRMVKTKVSVEELFLNYPSFPAMYDPNDSTRLDTKQTGEWIYYFPDGNVQARYLYDHVGTSIGKWSNYSPDGRLEETSTYNDHGEMEFHDRYEYHKNETLPIIKRWKGNNVPVFILGSQDSLQLDQKDFHEVLPADSALVKQIRIKNLSPRAFTITVLESSLLHLKTTSAITTNIS